MKKAKLYQNNQSRQYIYYESNSSFLTRIVLYYPLSLNCIPLYNSGYIFIFPSVDVSTILILVLIKKNNSRLLYHYFLKLFGKNKLVKSVKLLPLNIKSTNSIQKYPNIIES